MRDQLFQGTAARGSDFAFTQEVAEVFDDMLSRSVPFYLEQQMIIKELAIKFFAEGTLIYDLGCSTGTTLINMAHDLRPHEPRLVGYDNSMPMVEKARARIKEQELDHLIEIRCGDLNEVIFEQPSIVTLCWALQFVRPLHREGLIRRIYDSLVDHGALIITEKVLTNSGDMNRLFIELYYEFKRRNGYSDEQITQKREALENVLIPYRVEENMLLFRRAGFTSVETFFQWYNFVGFLCVKKP